MHDSRMRTLWRNPEQIKEGLALSLLALLQIVISGLFLHDANDFVAKFDPVFLAERIAALCGLAA